MATPAGEVEGGGRELTLRYGIRCVPDVDVSVEGVLLAVGEHVGCQNLSYASQMIRRWLCF